MSDTTEAAKSAILLVEDNAEDFEATARALSKAGMVDALVRCENGDEALDFLHRRGRFAPPVEAQRPGIILLDLNLPGTEGRAVLNAVKSHDRLKGIPVIVLTSSGDQRDIDGCYQAGASGYIQKPVNLRGLMTAIQRLKEYWFDTVILPRPDMIQPGRLGT